MFNRMKKYACQQLDKITNSVSFFYQYNTFKSILRYPQSIIEHLQ